VTLPYVPEYKIEIDGARIPVALRAAITNISYQDGIEGADRVEVTIANQNMRFLDDPLLQVDNGFKLSIGYSPKPLEEVFVGEITGIEPSFPNSGMPTIKIVAQDFLQRLTRGKADRAFFKKGSCVNNFPLPDLAVVSMVAASNLLIPYPDPIGGPLSVLLGIAVYLLDPTEAQKGIRKQLSENDFDFLSRISKANGWEMSIDHTIELPPHGYYLRFRSLTQGYTSDLTLKYGQSLMEFTPKITTVGDVSGVAARLWCSTLQMEFEIVVGWDFDRGTFTLKISPGFGQLETVADASKTLKTVYTKPVSFAEAGLKILGELLPRLNNRLTGSGSTLGNPRIKSGTVIDVEGVGDQFGGKYRVTSATHTFGTSGYKTSFEARKEVWFDSLKSLAKPNTLGGAFTVQGRRLGR